MAKKVDGIRFVGKFPTMNFARSPTVEYILIDMCMCQVLLGGGRAYMTPDNFSDPEYPEQTGERTDGRNLIQVTIDV